MAQAALDRPPSLTDAVVAHVRDSIVRGDYAPGQPLTEAQLASDLGTSRGTVREALRVLGNIGLVTRSPHRGVSVTTLDSRSAVEIYTLRVTLESFAARLAVTRGNLDAAAFEMLEGGLASIERAAQAGDVPGMVDADMSFHTALSALSEHMLLMEQLGAIQVHSRRLLFYSDLYRPQPDVVVRRHRDLLDALRTQDPHTAALAVEHHIVGPHEDIVARLIEHERGAAGADAHG